MKKPTALKGKHGVGLSKRSLDFAPLTANDETSSVDVVITTETPVLTMIPDPSYRGSPDKCPMICAWEILPMAALDFSRAYRMPLLDGHEDKQGIDKVLGRVENIRIEGTTVVGTAFFRESKMDIYRDIKAGFLGQISAGYVVNKYRQVPSPDGETLPTFEAVSWTLLETSVVPLAADINAGVRSLPTFENQENIMTLTEALQAIVDAINALSDADATDATDAEKAMADALAACVKEEKAEPAGDETPAEAAAVEEVRSLAKSYGKLREIDDLRKLGARAAELKTALRSAIASGASFNPVKVEPVTAKKQEGARSAPKIDTAKIFANARAAFKGRA